METLDNKKLEEVENKFDMMVDELRIFLDTCEDTYLSFETELNEVLGNSYEEKDVCKKILDPIASEAGGAREKINAKYERALEIYNDFKCKRLMEIVMKSSSEAVKAIKYHEDYFLKFLNEAKKIQISDHLVMEIIESVFAENEDSVSEENQAKVMKLAMILDNEFYLFMRRWKASVDIAISCSKQLFDIITSELDITHTIEKDNPLFAMRKISTAFFSFDSIAGIGIVLAVPILVILLGIGIYLYFQKPGKFKEFNYPVDDVKEETQMPPDPKRLNHDDVDRKSVV